jgi:hypothetical protein
MSTPLAERFANAKRAQRPAPDRQVNHRPMEEAVIDLAGAWVTELAQAAAVLTGGRPRSGWNTSHAMNR